ncbi:hypothetical protein [Streptomyces sp. NPDC029674]|uniref:hypothetical protein n=1 Tax=Streptomyces sp. NPDC029674 TaxID=3365297 RepID=UPI003851189D
MTEIDIRHYDHRDAAELRPLLLQVYAEVYAKAAEDDPFASVDRFAEGLDGWSQRPGWSCVIGYTDDGQAVGYAYGAPCPGTPGGGADCSPRCPPTSSPRPAPVPTPSPS